MAWPGESTVVRVRFGRDRDLLAVVEDVDPLGSGGVEPAVERVEQVAVDHGRRAHEPGGIGEVAGAALVHVDGGVRERPGHVADAAGVVEVDVGDDDAGQVVGADPEGVELGEQRRRPTTAHPVSTSTGASPSTRKPAVTRSQPPSSVSIWTTPGAMRSAM